MNVIGTNDVNAGNLIFASGTIGSSIIFRSPDFLPTDLANLLSWYSSDYGVYNSPGVLANNNQTVSIWQNKINNATDLIHHNVSFQPKYVNNAIEFKGINILTGQNPSFINYPINYYVATQTILSGNNSTIPALIIKQGLSNSATQNKYGFAINTGSTLGIRDLNTTTLSNITMSNGQNIIYTIFSGSNTQILGKQNSSEILNATTNSNSNIIFVIGSSNGTTPTDSLYGSIYEILIYTGTAHTESERTKIINYLGSRWGVSI